MPSPFKARSLGALRLLGTFLAGGAFGVSGQDQGDELFKKQVQPILVQYCYDCHGDGMDKGKVSFDEFKSHQEILAGKELWFAVLKNVRAGIMPPEKKKKPAAHEIAVLEKWIKEEVFKTNPAEPDPGKVTIRRLNRIEYRNTIRDLMGIEFRTDEEFPPDDSGYGFDNIGDVLSVSPLLLEKYMQAAETIVASAVPLVSKVVAETSYSGKELKGENGITGDYLSFYKEAKLQRVFQASRPGDYRLILDLNVRGAFDSDPGKCRFVFKVNGQELLSQEFVWDDNKKFHFEFPEKWEAGKRELTFELHPLTPESEKKSSVDMRISSLKIQGPLEKQHWVRTKNYDRFFTRDEAPSGRVERKAYAREVLQGFTTKAFRRPVDHRYLDKLVLFAEQNYSVPGKKFEEGVARAMVAVLASPRFLFRLEEPVLPGGDRYSVPLDDYSLASRLSYFLWSTMPDQELYDLASRGELRKNLPAQVNRLLADGRSKQLVENFIGQWLQTRDVEGISINPRVVLARDNGQEKELQREEEEFRRRRAAFNNLAATNNPAGTNLAGLTNVASLTNLAGVTNLAGSTNLAGAATNRQRFFNRRRPTVELDGPLRQAMKEETELFFAHLIKENRSVLEMLDSNYTYLNERLARHYGMTNITGNEMRKVELPPESPRGGLLTHGSVLLVTSNPTRTSPVKRGLFVLENILGSPPPPPPADVPQLEEAEKTFGEKEPTLREVLEMHASKPLCSSCHSRMDPLGLALENFNALGMWREKERGQTIETASQLITGEKFAGIRELKTILRDRKQLDFYRCLTEKLLTYALGRGVEYYDTHTIDGIVERLVRDEGRISALLMGIVESSPFQNRRKVVGMALDSTTKPATELKEARLAQ